MISNPVAPNSGSGKNQPEFTFSGGSELYYVRVSESFRGGAYVPFNAVLMADDEQHVRQILSELITFCRECLAEYEHSNDTFRLEERTKRINCIQGALDGTNEFDLYILKAPTNQFFKIDDCDNSLHL